MRTSSQIVEFRFQRYLVLVANDLLKIDNRLFNGVGSVLRNSYIEMMQFSFRVNHLDKRLNVLNCGHFPATDYHVSQGPSSRSFRAPSQQC